jgi:hypothetical protein
VGEGGEEGGLTGVCCGVWEQKEMQQAAVAVGGKEIRDRTRSPASPVRTCVFL